MAVIDDHRGRGLFDKIAVSLLGFDLVGNIGGRAAISLERSIEGTVIGNTARAAVQRSAVRTNPTVSEIAERPMGNQVLDVIAPVVIVFDIDPHRFPARTTDKGFGRQKFASLGATGRGGEPEIGVHFPHPVGR